MQNYKCNKTTNVTGKINQGQPKQNHKINTKCIMTWRKKNSNELLMVTIWEKKNFIGKK